MQDDLRSAISDAVAGRTCLVARLEGGWRFSFATTEGEACSVMVHAAWRIISGGEIALADTDDGQRFGLPEPVDAEAKANALFRGLQAVAFEIDRTTADIRVSFDNDVRLDVFNNSSGYEGWTATFPLGDQEIILIGGGGGHVSFVSYPRGSKPAVLVGRPLP